MTDAPEVNLHNTTDARVWADEFCKNWPTALSQVPGREGVETEDSFNEIMIGWFANAMMAKADELARLTPEAGWQPIETAPRDGTDVLVNSAEGIELAWYSDGQGAWMTRDGTYVPADPDAWMHLPPPPGEAVPPAVKVKPLTWSEDHGDGYRIFYANTPVGRFAFGTDKFGQSYWQGNTTMDLGKDVASEAEAEKEAQAAYAAAIMKTDIFKCLNLVQEGEPGEQPDAAQIDALAECLSSFLSHTDGWNEEQLRKRWGDDYVQNVLRSRAALRALEGGE